MTTPNYAFEKRRRELDKKAKKEEKRQHKLAAATAPAPQGVENPPTPTGDKLPQPAAPHL